jgi:conjugal transfer pilus assembly protein TrbC
MRGLYKDSFEATRLKVESIGIAYDIDPELFEKYQVVTVPTIVKVEGDSWQKVAGHITLAAALEIFAGK